MVTLVNFWLLQINLPKGLPVTIECKKAMTGCCRILGRLQRLLCLIMLMVFLRSAALFRGVSSERALWLTGNVFQNLRNNLMSKINIVIITVRAVFTLYQSIIQAVTENIGRDCNKFLPLSSKIKITDSELKRRFICARFHDSDRINHSVLLH